MKKLLTAIFATWIAAAFIFPQQASAQEDITPNKKLYGKSFYHQKAEVLSQGLILSARDRSFQVKSLVSS